MLIKKFSFSFFLLVILINTSILYSQVERPPVLDETAMIMIKETYNLINQGGDKVWKDWSKNKFPVLLIDQDYLFLINLPQPPSDFTEYKETDPDLGKIYYKKGSLSPDLRASFLLNNQPVAAIGVQKGDFSMIKWVGNLTQEMFHAYIFSQPQTKEKIDSLKLGTAENQDWQSSYPFPYSDDIISLIISQQYSKLKDPLSANEEIIGKLNNAYEIIMIYKQYLTNSFKDIDAYSYSKYREWMDGVGFYTEYKILEFAASEEYKPTQAFADHILYKDDGGYKKYFNLYSKAIKHKFTNYEFLPTNQPRQFSYLGMEKALLLDKALPDWKSKFFDKETWLDDLIKQSINKITYYKNKLTKPTRLYAENPMPLDEVLEAVGESCMVPVNFAEGAKEKLHKTDYKPAFIDTPAIQILEFFVEMFNLTITLNEKGIWVDKVE